MRAFVGIDMPRSYRELLEECIGRWKGRLKSRLGWTNPQGWHLTLKFLGEVGEGALPEVVRALGAVTFAPIPLQAGQAGAFPDARRPRVVWVGLARGAEAVISLARQVEDALSPLGFPTEVRGFTPHLTVARVREAVRSDPWDELLADLSAVDWPETELCRVVLWRSILAPQGASYVELAEVKAGGATPGSLPG